MVASPFQAIREYGLDPPGHERGPNCDREGPALGPIRLLRKTEMGFEARPAEELEPLLTRIFARSIDCSGLMPGLSAVARALNEGDLARAVITTTHLRLPTLGEEEARRAREAAALAKAAADDPEHPGWPKGAPGGKGGQFRPKEQTGAAAQRTSRKKTEEELLRHIQRLMIREALREILSPARIARLLGEAAANAIPGLNVAADIAMMADVASMAMDFAILKRDTDAALEFVKNGPYELEDLLVDKQERSFVSFDALKKVDFTKFYASAGDGWEYHHIVEQNKEGTIPAQEINSTRNVIRVPKLLHEEITGEYARIDRKVGSSLRERLEALSFDAQHGEGVKVLRNIGIIE